MRIYANRSMLKVAVLITYVFFVIHIQFYISCSGQWSLAYALSHILVFVVLLVICPYLLAGVGRFRIPIKDRVQGVVNAGSTNGRISIVWGIGYFVTAFCILYFWYQAYYPGALSPESFEQYNQVLSGIYTDSRPILHTLFTFTFPLKLTGEISSIVLFQIIEYAAVIGYMCYMLFKYGGKFVSAAAFLFVILNPATGCMVVCPREDVTFAMGAVLLMTLGLQIHMTDGKWLKSRWSVAFFILTLCFTTLVKHNGILFTLPFLIVVLRCIDSKKKARFIIFFILAIDLIKGVLYPMLTDSAETYEMESLRIPVTLEELKETDLVYAIDGATDWGIWPGIAENDLGLELQENSERDLLVRYTEYSRNSVIKYLFWYVGVINLVIMVVALGKGGNKSLYVLPLLCHNFASLILQTGSKYRDLYMNFPILPVLLFLLLGEREGEQEDGRKVKKVAVSDSVSEEGKGECRRISYTYGIAILYTLILFALNFLQVYNSDFWSDEGYSIMLSRMSFSDMLDATANDVHPPLYYTLLQIICRIMDFRWSSYRLLSIIPYGIMLVFALTVVWKKFGKETALILITCSSLLNTAVEYNVQTRMYSWGALFVLLSFYYLRGILEYNRIRDYAGFVAMSLGAAYTHYYCLISVAFFYLVLLVVAVVRRKEYLVRVFVACGITVAAYLPWFIILLQTFVRTSEYYWMTEIPSFWDCMLYLFSSRCEKILLLLFLVMTVVPIAYKTGIVQYAKSEKWNFTVSFGISGFRLSRETVWSIAGLLGILGTVLTGIAVSMIFRPMFSVRYVYPVSAVAWLMLGIVLSKCRRKTACTAIIVVLIVRNCLPFYLGNYYWLEYCEDKLETVLKVTEEISANDVILTDAPLMDWTIINTYYPGVCHGMFAAWNMEVLQEYDDYWLFLGNEMDADKALFLEESGYEVTERINDGNLGRMAVYIYEVKRATNE